MLPDVDLPENENIVCFCHACTSNQGIGLQQCMDPLKYDSVFVIIDLGLDGMELVGQAGRRTLIFLIYDNCPRLSDHLYLCFRPGVHKPRSTFVVNVI